MKQPPTPDRDSESKFLRDWLDLMQHALDLRARGERQGYAIPTVMRRLTEDESGAQPDQGRAMIPRMPAPSDAPQDMKRDWIWVPIDNPSTQPRTVVRAILRAAGGPVPVKRLVERLGVLRPSQKINEGSIANIGTFLGKSGAILRDAEGWRLAPDATAPAMSSTHLFGPTGEFLMHEVALFRREAILHLLRAVPRGGLQPVQIVQHLNEMEWVPEPKGTDVVKLDIQALQKDKSIVRVGASQKWALQEREQK